MSRPGAGHSAAVAGSRRAEPESGIVPKLTSLRDVPAGLFIGGRWRGSTDGSTLPVENPTKGVIAGRVADATVADGILALDAAVDAQAQWSKSTPRERSDVLRAAFDALKRRADWFARIISLEMGKSLQEAAEEVDYGAEFFRWFSEEAVRIRGGWSQAPNGGSRLVTMKKPVGPTLMITPWNFPLAMGTRKIGPAVASGCTMVVKPASETPLTMMALAELLHECGLPGGVLNVIPTTRNDAVVQSIMSDPRLRKLSFTGSTAVGQLLVQRAAQGMLRVSMELGGNAPFIVFEDADLARAVPAALDAKMRNSGEACTAANRFIVHESVATDFTQELVRRMKSLCVGATDESRGVRALGPLITADARNRVHELVEDARCQGATVLLGGHPVDAEGYFYEPTVLTDVPDTAKILHEEIFGPVASIRTFVAEDRAIREANATDYGLAAYVFTADLDRAIRVSEALDAGMIGLNTGIVSNPAAPFGGVKGSGLGREGGAEGIEEYLETVYVGIDV